jgi:hypothetical protein
MRQNKEIEPHSDSIGLGKALTKIGFVALRRPGNGHDAVRPKKRRLMAAAPRTAGIWKRVGEGRRKATLLHMPSGETGSLNIRSTRAEKNDQTAVRRRMFGGARQWIAALSDCGPLDISAAMCEDSLSVATRRKHEACPFRGLPHAEQLNGQTMLWSQFISRACRSYAIEAIADDPIKMCTGLVAIRPGPGGLGTRACGDFLLVSKPTR